jgi:hypothetical protein
MANKTRYMTIDWEAHIVNVFNELDTMKMHLSNIAEDNGSDENGVTSDDISVEVYKVSCSAKPEQVNLELSIKKDWNICSGSASS